MPTSIPWSRTLLLLVFATGCAQYVHDFQYQPRPALAEVRSVATQAAPPSVTALASVIGIRYADKNMEIPESVEVRVRIDATGSESLVFDPHTMTLTSGTLTDFPPPRVSLAGPASLTPAQSVIATAYFPFPAGLSYLNTDLSTLQLRWLIQVNGQPVRQVAYFSRVPTVYYSTPYYAYPPYPYGYGVDPPGYHHRYRR